MKLSDIASALNASLENADGNTEITGVAGIEEAAAGHITFVANPKYAALAKTTPASAVIVSEDFPAIPGGMLRSSNPYLAFARAINLFYQTPAYAPGIHPTAVIAPTAKIGKNAHIGAYVVVEDDVQIGDNAVLLPHVVIYRGVIVGKNFFAHAHAVVREFCTLGDNVVLQNGVIVGCDGFGFARDGDHWEKITQSGPTVLEDNVEVQANSCIDRASVGETRVGRGAKVDNLVQVGLAGSTVVGKNVILAGQVGVAGHCTIGDGVIVTAQSGTHGDIPAGSMVSGSPAFDHKQWLRAVGIFSKLPELAKAIRAKQPGSSKSAKDEP